MSKAYDPLFDPNFVGYNCRDPESSGDFGIIDNVGNYAEEYFLSILENLPENLKEKIIKLDLMNVPKITDEKFNEWANKTCDFFKKNGIRWIFVREEIPQNDFESQFYYVSVPEEKILCSFDYLFDDEGMSIIVYSIKGSDKFRPKMYPVPDDFTDDVEENDFDSIEEEDSGDNDYESYSEDGKSYWESAWKGGRD